MYTENGRRPRSGNYQPLHFIDKETEAQKLNVLLKSNNQQVAEQGFKPKTTELKNPSSSRIHEQNSHYTAKMNLQPQKVNVNSVFQIQF